MLIINMQMKTHIQLYILPGILCPTLAVPYARTYPILMGWDAMRSGGMGWDGLEWMGWMGWDGMEMRMEDGDGWDGSGGDGKRLGSSRACI